MCDLCQLNKGTDGFILTICRTCGTPMVVSREHRAEFEEWEKRLIRAMFPGSRIRWEPRQIEDHAHCHIIPL